MKVDTSDRLFLAAGFLCCLLGLSGLIGWHGHLLALLQAVPNGVVISYNAALCFFFCGLACIFVHFEKVVPARLLGLLAALIGVATLIEHLFRVDLRIDQLFVRDIYPTFASEPGRMARTTAFSFVLSGLSLIILAWGRPGYRRPFVSAAMGAAISSLALASLAQYIFGATTPLAENGFVEMPLHTSGGFLILGAGILIASWRSWSQSFKGSLAIGGFLPPSLMRPWAPIVTTCVVAAFSLLIWRALVIKQDREVQRLVGLEATKVEDLLVTQFAVRVTALRHLGQQGEVFGPPTESQWAQESQLVMRDLPGWQSIAMTDATGRALRLYPPSEGSIAAFPSGDVKSGSSETTRMTLTGDGRNLLLTSPNPSTNQRQGCLVGMFRPTTLFDAILPEHVTDGFAVAVDVAATNGRLWDRAASSETLAEPPLRTAGHSHPRDWEQDRTLNLYGLNLRLRIRPTLPSLAQEESSVPGVALGLGLLFAGMVGATIHFAQTARIHSLYISSVNERLEREISNRLDYMRQVEVERESALKGWAEAERQSALLKNQAQELKRSNESLSAFASIASHDLKEPLRKIQTFGDLLQRRAGHSLDADAGGYLERMTAAAARMQSLIDGLLAYSRASTRPPELVPVDLNEVIRDVVGDLEGRLVESGGTVDAGPLPALKADPVQMRQLFQNLIGNGLKFRRPNMPSRVQITGRVENDRAHIVVSDNGIGFDPKFANRIFRIFERLETSSEFDGTGIGLAICRAIVDRHHGTIVASGAPGEGATFTIELPLATDNDA